MRPPLPPRYPRSEAARGCVAAGAQRLLQWFDDKQNEKEYRYFAFVPSVRRLAVIIIGLSILYSVSLGVSAGMAAQSTTAGIRPLSIALRLAYAFVALAVGIVLGHALRDG